MKNTVVNAQGLRAILAHISETIQKRETELNALDSAIGDGDHGITMRTGFDAVKARVAELPPEAGIDAVLEEAGYAFMEATGGAIGIILGKSLVAGGQALAGRPALGVPELKTLLGTMESAISATGKSQPGDKTILDSVHAANQALVPFGEERDDLITALATATEAAEQAAQATANMLCQKGRASRLGERVLGHPDPGAVSFGIILRAMLEWVQQNQPRQASS
jgi:dihydroxyacetone kinase phosphoprotein-dependent L subunit